MAVNRGKQFETKFKEGIEEVWGISLDRFPDPMAGFLGVRNICDFGVYQYPYQYYIECKTIRGNTLNYKSGITENQWRGLIEKSEIRGVLAGILVWFIDHDITVFVEINQLRISQDKGIKSLNIKDIKEEKIKYVELEGEKKRVFFEYDFIDFTHRLYLYTKQRWED